jgi:uncharacterized membrane-anchored protein YitT (DUF2179 family)
MSKGNKSLAAEKVGKPAKVGKSAEIGKPRRRLFRRKANARHLHPLEPITIRSTVMKWVIDLALVILGSMMYAAGIVIFTAPNDIAPGGFTGIATIVNHYTGWPIGTMYALMNLPIAICGFIFLGKGMMIKTLVAIVVLTVSTDYIFAGLPSYHATESTMMLVAVFGGVLFGTGLGLVYVRDATTGGSDVVNRILNKKIPQFSLGRIQLVMDAAIVITAIFVFGRVEAGLYAMISIFIETRVIDLLMYGSLEAKLLLIFSNKYEEITQRIMVDQKRGVTLLEGHGAYSGTQRQVICCAVHKNQYPKIKRMVSQIDPQAFIVATNAGEVYGLGFSVNKE